jgi:hypothetical protein
MRRARRTIGTELMKLIKLFELEELEIERQE